MLTLDLPVEPYWLDLPRGVRVEIRLVTDTDPLALPYSGDYVEDLDESRVRPWEGP